MDDTDTKLLARYASHHAEDAFAEIVRRHLGLVYSAALRQVRAPQLAEEVAQSTFIKLARHAGQLAPDTILPAWLYQVTRREAIDVVRREASRQLRESRWCGTTEMNAMNATAADWTHIEPLLDEAMHALDDTDRAAVLLRYFENKSLREVGATLGTSENAAQKRLVRAVERLREFFTKRGVTVGTSGLVVVISANAVQAAPVGLAVTISAAAIAGTTLTTIATATTIKTIAMTTLQKTLIAAAITVAVGTGIYEALQTSTLRRQVQTLQQQQAPLTEQLAQLQTANERLSNQVVTIRNSPSLSNAQFNELMQLRGKSGVAQADSRELAQLKSTLAEQSGKTPDYMTNAMAMGAAALEKIKMKDAQARLGRMKQALNLTDVQARSITDITKRHVQRQTEMAMDALAGKNTLEQRLIIAAEGGNQDDEIKALLTAEQLAAYSEFQQAEKSAVADKAANDEASQIVDDFSLSQEQHEQIRTAFYQMNVNEPAKGLTKEAIAAAGKSGNIVEAISMRIELSKAQLDEKLKILGSILTPEQINTYRGQQTKQIDMIAAAMNAAMKMARPQNPAGTEK